MKNQKIDADKLWEVAWTYIKTVVDTLREPFLILDKDLRAAFDLGFSWIALVVNEESQSVSQASSPVPSPTTAIESATPSATLSEDF